LGSEGRARERLLVAPTVAGISSPFLSINLPPPPGPPGTYFRRFSGGSVAATMLPSRVRRAPLTELFVRPRRTDAADCRGVLGLGAIIYGRNRPRIRRWMTMRGGLLSASQGGSEGGQSAAEVGTQALVGANHVRLMRFWSCKVSFVSFWQENSLDSRICGGGDVGERRRGALRTRCVRSAVRWH
jgi:hypothetical protein